LPTKGHLLKDCTKERTCAHYGRRKSHHHSLCNKVFQQTLNVQNISYLDNVDDTTPVPSSQVLMQTETTLIRNTQGDSSASVDLILDSGSQRSYITEKLAKLILDPTEKLSVITFGLDEPKKIDCKPSKLQLILRDGSVMSLKITVVPSITGKINQAPVKVEDVEFLNKQFSENKLADSSPCHTESSIIEMLIGNVYYFDLLQPQKVDLGKGLFLLHSKLGWILGG